MHYVAIAGVVCIVNAQAVQAQTQGWPSRPLRIISGFQPGGATDVAARAAAQKLTESLGQSVVVENRPGAAGNLAAEMVARGTPDGYSIYLANATLATPSLFAKVPFDINKDFAFISMIGMGPSALVVHPSLPVRNVKELLALARARPGTLNYASGGTGNITHLAMALLVSMTGVDMVHVPYKGGAPSTIATVSGEAQLMFGSIASALSQIQQGACVRLPCPRSSVARHCRRCPRCMNRACRVTTPVRGTAGDGCGHAGAHRVATERGHDESAGDTGDA